MEKFFEEAAQRVDKYNLSDLLLFHNYSTNKEMQKAFDDGYAIGVLSSLLYSSLQQKGDTELFGLYRAAINGDESAIRELEAKLKE